MTYPTRERSAGEPAGEPVAVLARNYGEGRGLATPDVEEFDGYADRNQDEWREEAGALLDVVDDIRAGREPSVGPTDLL